MVPDIFVLQAVSGFQIRDFDLLIPLCIQDVPKVGIPK